MALAGSGRKALNGCMLAMLFFLVITVGKGGKGNGLFRICDFGFMILDL
jgi:hypothetical protein